MSHKKVNPTSSEELLREERTLDRQRPRTMKEMRRLIAARRKNFDRQIRLMLVQGIDDNLCPWSTSTHRASSRPTA